MDTRRSKGERETKDHLEKDYGKREKHGWVEELECDKAATWNRECWADNVTALYAPTGAVSYDDD